MSTTYNFKVEIKANLSGLNSQFGNNYAPYQFTTSGGLLSSKRRMVGASELVDAYDSAAYNIGGSTPTFIMCIPSIDGNFWWSGATVADNSTSLSWKAGIPLIFSTGKTLPYDATATTRITGTPEALNIVYFYNTSSSATGYVDTYCAS